MTDRRRDDRVQIGLECMLYIEGLDEMEATVKDISEIGIAFEINFNEVLYDDLKNKKKLQFAYLDEFEFLQTHIEVVLQATCEIVRVSEESGKIVIGCTLNADKDIRHYVTQRKVKKFVDSMYEFKGSKREKRQREETKRRDRETGGLKG